METSYQSVGGKSKNVGAQDFVNESVKRCNDHSLCLTLQSQPSRSDRLLA